jgi:hypothetical protein
MFISILFQLTIFILLAIQLTQLLKQYALPFLRQQIAALNKLWKDFQDKIDLLKTTKKRVDKTIKNQEEILENLESAIECWHKNLVQKQKAEEISQVELFEKIRKKKKEQYEHAQRRNIENSLIPEAIKQAKEQLKEKYFAKENGKQVLTRIIEEL